MRQTRCLIRLPMLPLWALCLGVPGAGVEATPDPAGLCIDAAAEASRSSGVPEEVLLAITLVETGRNGRPWPWTVNFGGDGRWLDTASEAAAVVEAALAEGVTNIDLGCFQLNHRWHASGFASVEDMLDPVTNARYAADFLASHFETTGDWAEAAAAYHSGTPEFATRYRARFETVLAGLGGEMTAPRTDPLPERENRFPLLLAGTRGTRGSLVPQGAGGMRLIGAP
jgi:Transglycosylase SLT domain